jgi:hypothetical protein
MKFLVQTKDKNAKKAIEEFIRECKLAYDAALKKLPSFISSKVPYFDIHYTTSKEGIMLFIPIGASMIAFPVGMFKGRAIKKMEKNLLNYMVGKGISCRVKYVGD